jgi:hypothetical protein
MKPSSRRAAALALAALAGCSPTLDWREVRPPGSHAQALFPCKPASHARTVTLAGAAVEMSMYACAVSQVSYALAFADMVDPALVTPALEELARSARAHLASSGAPGASSPLAVAGATPNPRSASWTLSGRLPDGRLVNERLALFAWGTRVYQATAVGERLDASALETFFASLKVGS